VTKIQLLQALKLYSIAPQPFWFCVLKLSKLCLMRIRFENKSDRSEYM
jgi:hypothetical protein